MARWHLIDTKIFYVRPGPLEKWKCEFNLVLVSHIVLYINYNMEVL